MNEPKRWRELDGGATPEVRALFQNGERPQPMTPAEQAIARQRIAQIAAGPSFVLGKTAKLLLGSTGTGLTAAVLALSLFKSSPSQLPPEKAPANHVAHRERLPEKQSTAASSINNPGGSLSAAPSAML